MYMQLAQGMPRAVLQLGRTGQLALGKPGAVWYGVGIIHVAAALYSDAYVAAGSAIAAQRPG